MFQQTGDPAIKGTQMVFKTYRRIQKPKPINNQLRMQSTAYQSAFEQNKMKSNILNKSLADQKYAEEFHNYNSSLRKVETLNETTEFERATQFTPENDKRGEQDYSNMDLHSVFKNPIYNLIQDSSGEKFRHREYPQLIQYSNTQVPKIIMPEVSNESPNVVTLPIQKYADLDSYRSKMMDGGEHQQSPFNAQNHSIVNYQEQNEQQSLAKKLTNEIADFIGQYKRQLRPLSKDKRIKMNSLKSSLHTTIQDQEENMKQTSRNDTTQHSFNQSKASFTKLPMHAANISIVLKRSAAAKRNYEYKIQKQVVPFQNILKAEKVSLFNHFQDTQQPAKKDQSIDYQDMSTDLMSQEQNNYYEGALKPSALINQQKKRQRMPNRSFDVSGNSFNLLKANNNMKNTNSNLYQPFDSENKPRLQTANNFHNHRMIIKHISPTYKNGSTNKLNNENSKLAYGFVTLSNFPKRDVMTSPGGVLRQNIQLRQASPFDCNGNPLPQEEIDIDQALIRNSMSLYPGDTVSALNLIDTPLSPKLQHGSSPFRSPRKLK